MAVGWSEFDTVPKNPPKPRWFVLEIPMINPLLVHLVIFTVVLRDTPTNPPTLRSGSWETIDALLMQLLNVTVELFVEIAPAKPPIPAVSASVMCPVVIIVTEPSLVQSVKVQLPDIFPINPPWEILTAVKVFSVIALIPTLEVTFSKSP